MWHVTSNKSWLQFVRWLIETFSWCNSWKIVFNLNQRINRLHLGMSRDSKRSSNQICTCHSWESPGSILTSSHLVCKSVLKNICPTSRWVPAWTVWIWSLAVFSSTITRLLPDSIRQSFLCFSVTLNKQPIAPGETWHSSVVKLSVDHATEGTVGYIYWWFVRAVVAGCSGSRFSFLLWF